jgi:hypothetical protein
MPGLSALEAEVVATLTCHMIFPILADETTTIRAGTPPQVRVCVHVNVFLKSQVLLKDLLRAKLSDVFPSVLRRACLVRALDLIHFSVGNIKLQIVTLTVEAVSVRTL